MLFVCVARYTPATDLTAPECAMAVSFISIDSFLKCYRSPRFKVYLLKAGPLTSDLLSGSCWSLSLIWGTAWQWEWCGRRESVRRQPETTEHMTDMRR